MKNKKIKPYNVAVISYDIDDFLSWKEENNLISNELDLVKKFKVNHKTYYCVNKINDLCSKRFDKVIETKIAKKNEEYPQIISFIMYNMINSQGEKKKHKIKLPSDIKMDKKILKIMDENLICGTKETNTEGIICNKFDTSIKIIKYIKKLIKK